jgi:hypothetical protein
MVKVRLSKTNAKCVYLIYLKNYYFPSQFVEKQILGHVLNLDHALVKLFSHLFPVLMLNTHATK